MRRTPILMALAMLLAVSLWPAAASQASSDARDDTISLKDAGALFGPGAPDTVEIDYADPLGRAQAWMPQDPGTKKWITLDYGPYTIHPGSDLSRIDAEIAGQTGYAVSFKPSVVDAATGEELPSHMIHIHHAHWLWLDPEQEGYHRWFYGTGEERTQGSINPAAKADPRYKDGLRYGIKVNQGDHLGFLSMLHNKTAEAMEVYLRVEIEYVYGSDQEIEESKGWDFHNLSPTLIGSTFNVPRIGGEYVYPLDATKKNIGPHSNYHNPLPDSKIVPGVGQVLTVPWDGTVVIGAGHSHPGAREVVLSNMGSTKDPCPNDGDQFPGVTAARSRNITRGGVFPSEEFQMGLTTPGWRMYVHKGDRLVLNGVYSAKKYAYPDAMSYFGFYTDTEDKPTAAQQCKVELLDDPNATKDEINWTVPNHDWPSHHAMETCTRCDEPQDLPEPGPETNVVHIAGFQYLPGNQGLEGAPFGPPVVKKGDTLTVINEDYAAAAVRHSITSCKAPCNGAYQANYPFHDGVFHSGALGYMWEETYINAKTEPRYELDTSKLDKGWHTYYCQLHAWMRGSFYVK